MGLGAEARREGKRQELESSMLLLALGLAAASLGRDLHTKRCLPLRQTLLPEPVGVRGAPPHCLGGDLLSPQATRLSILHCWACSRGPHPLSKCIAPAPLPPADGVPRTRMGFEGIHKSPPPQRVSFIHLEGWPHGWTATALAPGPMLRGTLRSGRPHTWFQALLSPPWNSP